MKINSSIDSRIFAKQCENGSDIMNDLFELLYLWFMAIAFLGNMQLFPIVMVTTLECTKKYEPHFPLQLVEAAIALPEQSGMAR
jgi:hypothetical protein